MTTKLWTVFALCAALPLLASADEHGDPRDYGLSIYWLVFGFSAQALFMARMLVQWITSERRKSSVVPVSFWWLSLIGSTMLCVYFFRRGDPVGIFGQLFGTIVYVRNLILIYRKPVHDL